VAAPEQAMATAEVTKYDTDMIRRQTFWRRISRSSSSTSAALLPTTATRRR